MVTVAVRRINILDKKPILTDYLDPKIIYLLILPDVLIQTGFETLRLNGWLEISKIRGVSDKKHFIQI